MGFDGFDVEHVDNEAAQRLRDLADRARATLVAAGIPAPDITGQPSDGGAVIAVDTGADAAGGVYISWKFPRMQADEFIGYLLARQESSKAKVLLRG
jgi:hypothetical protein